MKTIVMINKEIKEMRKLSDFGHCVMVEAKRIGEFDVYFSEKRFDNIESVEGIYKRRGFVTIHAE